ncbi:MAG: hypothetical protein J4N80_10350, partial [Chloroflexi bacterium]|nr:hypothetical protein [Chloroflexota bacterium]
MTKRRELLALATLQSVNNLYGRYNYQPARTNQPPLNASFQTCHLDREPQRHRAATIVESV